MDVVAVTRVGFDILRAHSNVEKLCYLYDLSNEELRRIVNDETCIQLKLTPINLSHNDMVSSWSSVKRVLVDRVKNSLGIENEAHKFLAYSTGVLYTTVAHSIYSQIKQAYDNQGWAHWQSNNEIATKFEHSSMIATSRFGGDNTTTAELIKVKGTGTIKCTQNKSSKEDFITINVDLIIHSAVIDALRMTKLVGGKVDPDEFVKRIKWLGVDSEKVVDGKECTLL